VALGSCNSGGGRSSSNNSGGDIPHKNNHGYNLPDASPAEKLIKFAVRFY